MHDDVGLETLLDLNGLAYRLDNGYWVKFEAWRVDANAHIPHGVRYSLTLHDSHNRRLVGFDNAHGYQLPRRKRYCGRRVVWDHHHHSDEQVTPYEYESAARLIEDFWAEVDRVLQGDGP